MNLSAAALEDLIVGDALQAGGAAAAGAAARIAELERREAKYAAKSCENVCLVAGTPIATGQGEATIESLAVGARVLTTDGESNTQVDPATWRKARLRMPNPECAAAISTLQELHHQARLASAQ